MRLQDQVAIITGVSHAGQVGFALASAFAREGAKLAISSRSPERVNARAEELRAEGAQVIGVAADLTSEEGPRALIEETVNRYGRIDILVNLAGRRPPQRPTPPPNPAPLALGRTHNTPPPLPPSLLPSPPP